MRPTAHPPLLDGVVRAVLVDPGAKAGTAHGERHQPAHALTTTVTSPVCRSFTATSLCGLRLLDAGSAQRKGFRIIAWDAAQRRGKLGKRRCGVQSQAAWWGRLGPSPSEPFRRCRPSTASHSTARSSMNLMMLCRAEGVQARARTDVHSIWPSVVQVEAARTEETFREPWGAVN